MNRTEKRERALIIWMEKINLVPSDVQVDCALWDVQREMHDVKEELVEYIRAIRAFPRASKHEVFFGEDK
jgi:hypothetical protein